MKKVALAFGALGTAVLGLLVVPLASEAGSKSVEISVYEKEGGYQHVVDAGGTDAFEPGDTILENLALFDQANDKRVGHTVTRVTVVRTLGEDLLAYIDCEVRLGPGKVLLAGAARFSQILGDGARFEVTGGTGGYSGATGTVTLKGEERDGVQTFNLDFDLDV